MKFKGDIIITDPCYVIREKIKLRKMIGNFVVMVKEWKY